MRGGKREREVEEEGREKVEGRGREAMVYMYCSS